MLTPPPPLNCMCLFWFLLYAPTFQTLHFPVEAVSAFYQRPQPPLPSISSFRGGHNHHPLSENHVFSTTKHPVDPRLVCKFEFVRCGPVEKNRALYLSQFSCGGLTKFENSFFQIAKLRFCLSVRPRFWIWIEYLSQSLP